MCNGRTVRISKRICPDFADDRVLGRLHMPFPDAGRGLGPGRCPRVTVLVPEVRLFCWSSDANIS